MPKKNSSGALNVENYKRYQAVEENRRPQRGEQVKNNRVEKEHGQGSEAKRRRDKRKHNSETKENNKETNKQR